VRLTWHDNSTNETDFDIYDGNIHIATVGANTTAYTVGGLAPNSYHCFTVYARNSFGASDFPGWACATTLDDSCKTSAGAWQNSAIASQIGTFVAEFDATPDNINMDGVMGLSAGSADAYADLAVIARFNPSGYIDARNGAAYQAATQIPYSPGISYHFRMEISIPNHTYNVFVTPAGSSEQLVGANFAFRSEQSTVASLNNFALYAKTGSQQVCHLSIVPASNSANLGGTWSGSITQGGSFSFFVSNGDIVNDGFIELNDSFTCWKIHDFGPAYIVGNRFIHQLSGDSLRVTVTGTFHSSTSASGTYVVIDDRPGSFCRIDTTWTTAKP
jgi:hypothetical protein